MSKLTDIFKKKEEPVKNYDDFWRWFEKNEKNFFSVIKKQQRIEEDFFNSLSPKLAEIKDGYFYLVGMYDENTVELIITADGNIRNMVFVEELIEKAPSIQGWRFIAHKPELDIKNVVIQMGDYKFDENSLFFYPNENPAYPDEIDIYVTHTELSPENKTIMANGIYIFLDNYLGELSFVNNIDNLEIVPKEEISGKLVPISKLKDYVSWRQKEFIEKYEGERYNTENDEYSLLEAKLKSGNMLLATINTHLLQWDRKASHPWIAVLTIKYNGKNNNGMPDGSDYELLNKIEDEIMLELKDSDGYLNVGRQTADSEREIYFACKDFRKPAKVFYHVQQKYSLRFEIEYDIYKDKYWRSLERFNP